MSHELIKQLQEKRANVWEQAKALLDSAATDNRDLTAEEDQSWQRMNADLDGIDARVRSIAAGEQRFVGLDANARIDGGIDRHAEGYRRRQRYQHGGKTSPEIARMAHPGAGQFAHDPLLGSFTPGA